MAWFDIGAGLAEMGKSMAQSASLALLEQQKSDNDTERLRLANELATERESRGRKEAHGYDMEKLDKTQQFTGTQNDLDRQNRITTAGIGAGATLSAAQMQINARREEAALDRKERASELDLRLKAQRDGNATVKINDDGTASYVNPADRTVAPVLGPDNQPVKFRDVDRAKAQAELLVTTRDQYREINTQYKTEMKQAQDQLNKAQESITGRVDGDNDPGVIAAKEAIKEIRNRFEPRINLLDQRYNAISQSLTEKSGVKVPGTAPGQGKKLSDFDRTPDPEQVY